MSCPKITYMTILWMTIMFIKLFIYLLLFIKYSLFFLLKWLWLIMIKVSLGVLKWFLGSMSHCIWWCKRNQKGKNTIIRATLVGGQCLKLHFYNDQTLFKHNDWDWWFIFCNRFHYLQKYYCKTFIKIKISFICEKDSKHKSGHYFLISRILFAYQMCAIHSQTLGLCSWW